MIAKAFVERLAKEKFRVLCVSCSEEHLHALPELPQDRPTVKQIIGRCKRHACDAVAHLLQGSIWAADGEYKPVRTESHQQNAYDYITRKQGPGTFVWTFHGEEYWMPRSFDS